MDEGSLTEIEYETEASRIRLSRQNGGTVVAPMDTPAAVPVPVAAPSAVAPAAAAATVDDGLEIFSAPMVGTFYRLPSPEADPYVSVGDSITPESVLCILEAMKVMNEIKAECSGEIVEILVKDGEAVEFGQAIFKIRP